MISTIGRRVRAAATAAVMVALLAGTIWGLDDHFPFGPFKMYSTTNKTTGDVKVTRLEGTTATGEVVDLPFGSFGLRRAEVEGQLPRLVEDPSLLQHMIEAYEHFQPDEPALVELRVIQVIHPLEDGRPSETEEEMLAELREA